MYFKGVNLFDYKIWEIKEDGLCELILNNEVLVWDTISLALSLQTNKDGLLFLLPGALYLNFDEFNQRAWMNN